LASVWFFRPNNKELSIDTTEVPESKNYLEEDFQEEDCDSARVNLLCDIPHTDTSMSEMMDGRFLLDTRIVVGADKKAVYDQLLLRRGVVISMDSNGTYHYLSSSQGRILLAEVSTQVFSVDEYALHRPRRIDPLDQQYLPGEVFPGEEVFLVMPNEFESGIFANLESVLSKPLSHYGAASLSLELSQSGHLNFNLLSVVTVEGVRQNHTYSFRGI